MLKLFTAAAVAFLASCLPATAQDLRCEVDNEFEICFIDVPGVDLMETSDPTLFPCMSSPVKNMREKYPRPSMFGEEVLNMDLVNKVSPDMGTVVFVYVSEDGGRAASVLYDFPEDTGCIILTSELLEETM